MADIDPQSISVVISTFERPQACEQALLSALGQEDEPLEVLVCDNGSRDETQERFREWERRDARVRYLRLPANTGTPAALRNLGVLHARGDWVAFLDDDDEWLPEKLARQRLALRSHGGDVIASNALRGTGGEYFPNAPAIFEPSREQLLRANPIITSSALTRRSLPHFPEARWLRGIEDYAAWLDLADRGARFVILGDPLLRYEDAASDRLSHERLRVEVAVARLAWQRALRWPPLAGDVSAAARRTAGAAYVAAGAVRRGSHSPA